MLGLKKLDWYIIKKFLGTYIFSIVLIIAIAVVFDFSENMDKMMEHHAPWKAIVFEYYLNFIPYFGGKVEGITLRLALCCTLSLCDSHFSSVSFCGIDFYP